MSCQFFFLNSFTGHITALKLHWWEIKTCHLFTWSRSGQVQLQLWTAGASTDHPCSPAVSWASTHQHPQFPAQLCHLRRQQLHACRPEPLDRSRGSVTLWTHRADTHTTHSPETGIFGGKTTLTQCSVKQSPDHCSPQSMFWQLSWAWPPLAYRPNICLFFTLSKWVLGLHLTELEPVTLNDKSVTADHRVIVSALLFWPLTSIAVSALVLGLTWLNPGLGTDLET